MSFLKPEDVAEILQVDVSIIIGLLEQKKLIGIKFNNIWRIKQEDFHRFIEGQTKGKIGKYDKLYNYLVQSTESVLEFTFEEVEKINNKALPKSARKYRPWWGNDYTHSHALAWLNAGYKVSFANIRAGTVRFISTKSNKLL